MWRWNIVDGIFCWFVIRKLQKVSFSHTTHPAPDTAVLCQGFASVMNHMPDDETRAATSKFVVITTTADEDNESIAKLTTVTHHKVKAGAELTVDYYNHKRQDETLTAISSSTLHQQQSMMKTSVIPERSPEWLREHGHCLDNVRVRDEGGQQWALAARRFSAGAVLVTSPVLRLPSSMFDTNNHDGATTLRRYCIYTPSDNTYYFPYGPGLGYITRHHDDDEKRLTANVALRWAADSPLVQVYALRDIAMEEPLTLLLRGSQKDIGLIEMKEAAPHQFARTSL